MLDLLIIWALLFVCLIVFAVGRSRDAGALLLAYFLGLSLIHVPGILAFVTGAPGLSDGPQTRVGFEVTLIGMGAFVVGAILARGLGSPSVTLDAPTRLAVAREFKVSGWRLFLIGALTYLILIPVAWLVPSLSAVVAACATLLVVGLWSKIYGATIISDRARLIQFLAIVLVLPFASLLASGFIGYGVSWALSALTFLFVIARRRLYFYLCAPLAVFLGLSLFVTYMDHRTAIREVVWNDKTDLMDRISQVSPIATDFELLDLSSYKHRAALDSRLNQNFLVGVGVNRHNDGLNELLFGATVPWWALIPRAIWPDKPDVGGGGDVVASFTHIKFDRNTSVGVGQVLEFYMNFAMPGVVLGFAGLGYLLMRLDQGIMRALTGGDLPGLLIRAMPGLTLLQPGGNLLEIFVGLAAALAASHLMLFFQMFRASPVRNAAVRGARL